MSEEDQQHGHVAKKPRKSSSSNATALPTQDEQKQLQQMEILMKSNLLQLQSKELIGHVDATAKFSSKKLVDWLEQLKTDLLCTAKHTCHQREISAEWTQSQGYGIDLSSFVHHDVDSITYLAPSQVEVIGSFDSGAATAPLYNIDIAIYMPADIFSARDILNYAYFQKRALYLAGVRKSLEQIHKKQQTGGTATGGGYKNFKTLLMKADVKKPIIQLQPYYSESIVVRLIPVLPDHVMKPIQLRDSKNNVRPEEWMQVLQEQKNKGGAAKGKSSFIILLLLYSMILIMWTSSFCE